MQRNPKFGKEAATKFHKFFGGSLATFLDITGFDIIKFDEVEKARHPGTYVDGVSLADHVERTYGREAHDFIMDLIGAGLLYV